MESRTIAKTHKFILKAQGRLRKLAPVAIVDIGSNSVRMVIYEGLSRSPTPLFNEKVLCGLGSHLAATGRLDDAGVRRALEALKRFRFLARQAGADDVHVMATAAAREAENGRAFIKEAEAIMGCEIDVLSGSQEAYYAALGVVCGFRDPKGVCADMGGGSVEFTAIDSMPQGKGITLPLGGLRLRDMAGESPEEARRIARELLKDNRALLENRKKTFYAVGGTWRALGRLHMGRRNYPLRVMHNYEISAQQALKLCNKLASGETVRGMEAISSNRRDLLPYGAALLAEIIRVMKPTRIVFSALGVREGYLFSCLPKKTQKADALFTAAEEMAVLRARSPAYAREMGKWTGNSLKVFQIDETRREERLRKAACLLADTTWRSHPDYRGSQALNLISNANLFGVDHPGRVYIAMAIYFRHQGLSADSDPPAIHRLVPERLAYRAKLLGALFRVAYLLSAAMPGVLPRVRFQRDGEKSYSIVVPDDFARLRGERLDRRLSGLADVLNAELRWLVERQ